MSRAATWAAAALAAVTTSACFGPQIEDGAIACAIDNTCPPGFQCGSDGFCYRGEGPGFDASTGAADGPISIDAAPMADAESPADARPATAAAPTLYNLFGGGRGIGVTSGGVSRVLLTIGQGFVGLGKSETAGGGDRVEWGLLPGVNVP